MPRRSSAPGPAGGRRGRPRTSPRSASEADDLLPVPEEADAPSRPTESYEAILHAAKVFTTRAHATPALLAVWAAHEPRGLELLDQLATTTSALQHHQDEAAIANAELRAQRVDRDPLLARMVTWRSRLRAELVRATEGGTVEERAAARMVLGRVRTKSASTFSTLHDLVRLVLDTARVLPASFTAWLDLAGFESVAALRDACDALTLEADTLFFRRMTHADMARARWQDARRLLTLLGHRWDRARLHDRRLPQTPPLH